MTALRLRLIEDLQLRNFSSHIVEAHAADSSFNRVSHSLNSKQSP
ncbi:MAG TPA: hypothetical protein VHD85_02995 [Terracidiphilus sp.]|nr:hypothetical protein [Terracidiphilus sp.]